MTKLEALEFLQTLLRTGTPVPSSDPKEQADLAPIIATAGLTGIAHVTIRMVEQLIHEELKLQSSSSADKLPGSTESVPGVRKGFR